MEAQTKIDFRPGQVVRWGQDDNVTTGTIMTISLDRKTAFIFLGHSLLNGKPRYITVSTLKLKVVDNGEQRSTV